MLITLLILAGAWLALTIAGILVLAPLAREQRDGLLPAAPVFGVVLLVTVLHDTTLLVSVREGLWVVGMVMVLLAALAFHRDRTWWRPSRKAVATLLLTVACGAVPAVWALGPSAAVGGPGVVQPSDNNDAFYYVSVVEWLQDHPATSTPQISPTPDGPGVPPSYAPARAQITLNLRIGQELTHAALTTVMGTEARTTWYPITALWILLLPASGVAVARLLRLRLVTGLGFGVMTSVSALTLYQLASQNSDSLLGTALVPVAVGAVVHAVGRPSIGSMILAAISLTALVGTYTEYLPLIAPALVVAVLARRLSELRHTVVAGLVVVGTALAVSPLVWVRAVKSLIFLGGIPVDGYPSSFAGAPLGVIVSRFLGVSGPQDGEVAIVLSAVVGAFVVTGLLAAITCSKRRWFYLALVASGTFLAVYLVTVRDRPYTQQRVVQLLLPLVLLVSSAGWDRLSRRAAIRSRPAVSGRPRATHRRSPAHHGPVVVGALAVAGASAFVGSNSVTDHGFDLPRVAQTRYVGPAFDEAAHWIDRVGGRQGGNASVLVGDFFTQLWITDALREKTEVSYPTLYTSYQYQTSYWDGQPRRWLLTDRDAIRRVDRGVVVRRNSRFALLDLARGEAVVAVPADVFGQNSYVVLRSESTPKVVDLVGVTRSRAPTDVPPADGYGEDILPIGEPAGPVRVPLTLDNAVAARVVLSNDQQVFGLTKLRFRDNGQPPTISR